MFVRMGIILRFFEKEKKEVAILDNLLNLIMPHTFHSRLGVRF